MRADLAGDLDARELREHFGGALTYSLRSTNAGGAGDASPEERRARLLAAAADYDLIEIEHPGDAVRELLDRVPPEKRLIAWRGTAAGLEQLRSRFALVAETAARRYQLAVDATTIEQTIAPLQLLERLARSDVTAHATGPEGTWTRLLASRLGAPVVHGTVSATGLDGMLSVDRLQHDYGLPVLGNLRDLYGIVGGSVSYSLAPRVFNRGFRALGLPALCLPFSTPDFDRFFRGVVETGLPALGAPPRGLTVVTPHKEAALTVASLTTRRAGEAGAANSLVRAGSAWQAATTTAIRDALKEAGFGAAGRRAAVVGCGGAGRTVAGELKELGASVTLVNRGQARGDYASGLLGLPWVHLGSFDPGGYEILVNATPLSERSPVDVGALGDDAAIVDLVYTPSGRTALMTAARARGLVAIGGRRVLAGEAARQYQLMTGQPLPPDALEAVYEAVAGQG